MIKKSKRRLVPAELHVEFIITPRLTQHILSLLGRQNDELTRAIIPIINRMDQKRDRMREMEMGGSFTFGSQDPGQEIQELGGLLGEDTVTFIRTFYWMRNEMMYTE